MSWHRTPTRCNGNTMQCSARVEEHDHYGFSSYNRSFVESTNQTGWQSNRWRCTQCTWQGELERERGSLGGTPQGFRCVPKLVIIFFVQWANLSRDCLQSHMNFHMGVCIHQKNRRFLRFLHCKTRLRNLTLRRLSESGRVRSADRVTLQRYAEAEPCNVGRPLANDIARRKISGHQILRLTISVRRPSLLLLQLTW